MRSDMGAVGGVAAGRSAGDLTGGVAIVTGGCGPIGAAVCAALAARDVEVHAFDVDPAIEHERPTGVTGHVLDVADPVAAEALVHEVGASAGVDILVNNAGTNIRSDPFAVDQTTWDRIMDVNLQGYFTLARAVARGQVQRGRGAAIVNVSSTAATSALGRGNLVYALSKAAVNQLTRELAVEWAVHGLRVNAVQPAQVATPAWEQQRRTPEGKRLYDKVVSGIPLGRLVQPGELVGPILFLASPAASMVTGAVLPVDGGNLALNASGSLPEPTDPKG